MTSPTRSWRWFGVPLRSTGLVFAMRVRSYRGRGGVKGAGGVRWRKRSESRSSASRVAWAGCSPGRSSPRPVRRCSAARPCGRAMPGSAAISARRWAAQPIGVIVEDDPLEVFARSQAVLDFTSPAATVAHAELAAQARLVHVIGTTGLERDRPRAPRRRRAPRRDRPRRQHERRRQPADGADPARRRGARARLRHRDRRDAPPRQARRAVGHAR